MMEKQLQPVLCLSVLLFGGPELPCISFLKLITLTVCGQSHFVAVIGQQNRSADLYCITQVGGVREDAVYLLFRWRIKEKLNNRN
jgi:hypothetical protein